MLAAPPALFVCMLSSLRSAYDSCEPALDFFVSPFISPSILVDLWLTLTCAAFAAHLFDFQPSFV